MLGIFLAKNTSRVSAKLQHIDAAWPSLYSTMSMVAHECYPSSVWWKWQHGTKRLVQCTTIPYNGECQLENALQVANRCQRMVQPLRITCVIRIEIWQLTMLEIPFFDSVMVRSENKRMYVSELCLFAALHLWIDC